MQLYRLKEMADVFMDACVRDASGDLLFLSCYGRDTALTQLFAGFSLSPTEGGFTQLTLEGDDGREHRVSVAGAERFKKIAGRLPKENLFGNVAQAWIYDPVVVDPDRANRTGWVLLDLDRVSNEAGASERETGRRVWAMVQVLSPVPLLPAWEQAVRAATPDAVMDLMTSAFPSLGRVAALRVHLADDFGDRVSALVKSGAIGIGVDDRAAEAA